MTPPDPAELQELLARASAGDAAAIDELLARHRESLRRLIQLRLDPALRSRVDASDVVQDVLIEASRRLPEYLKNPIIPFPLWLRQMARDQMIDAYRHHRKAQRRSLDREQPLGESKEEASGADLLGQIPDRDLTPATAAMRHELQARIDSAVVGLEDDDREVLRLRLYEHLGNSDVATRLGLTEPAASMRFLRAMRRLHSVLAKDLSSSTIQLPKP